MKIFMEHIYAHQEGSTIEDELNNQVDGMTSTLEEQLFIMTDSSIYIAGMCVPNLPTESPG